MTLDQLLEWSTRSTGDRPFIHLERMAEAGTKLGEQAKSEYERGLAQLQANAASLPKIGILLAYFQLHPEAAQTLAAATRRELGLMIKASDNAMAAQFSQQLGLARIQSVLNSELASNAIRLEPLWITPAGLCTTACST